jgi:outer membrane receptor for ferrienterochelin and colicins
MRGMRQASVTTLVLLALLRGGVAAAQETAPPAADKPVEKAANQAADQAAQKPASSPPPATRNDASSIQITGKRDASEQRRISSAAKIIVTREDIEQYGDTSLADVIKRLPSVTVGGRPGRGGQIRMRGMGGGYTQILIDGERMAPGFSLDQITPDQIERIEILRAPTAETGARAIAGTINIVLREPIRQSGDDLRVGLSSERGGVQPNISFTRSSTLGETGTYSLNLSANHADTRTDTRGQTTYTNLQSGEVELAQQRLGQSRDRRESLNFNGRVQWQLGPAAGGPADSFSIQPFLVFSRSRSHNEGSLVQSVGNRPAPYAGSVGDSRNDNHNARLMLQLRKRLAADTRLELRGSLGSFGSSSASQLNQRDAAQAPVLEQTTDSRIRDRSFSLNGKLSQSLLDKHSLVAGLEAEGVKRSENTLTRLRGQPTLADFDGDLQASTQRLAAYVQDEWDPSPAWSAYAGLRWETLKTRSQSIGNPVSNTGTVLAPMAHAVWRINPPARDQVRISLTRSYRPPSLGNLTAIPRISLIDPVPGNNTAASADRAGNPDLRPELARGLDVAFEHYLAGGGVVSVSAFNRQITDLIRTVIAREAVPWSAANARYVARPQNVGKADTYGLELDAKFRLEEFSDGAPPLSLRGNLGLYRSKVAGVPGRNNRIDQQPRVSLNIGGDYRLRGLPLQMGANASIVPGYSVQQSELQSSSIDATRVVDAFALWTVSGTTRLRLSLSNIVPRNYVTSSTILSSGQAQTSVSNGPTYRVVALRLETRL